jgi:hypothetical protein
MKHQITIEFPNEESLNDWYQWYVDKGNQDMAETLTLEGREYPLLVYLDRVNNRLIHTNEI